jgi:hypothetical protein
MTKGRDEIDCIAPATNTHTHTDKWLSEWALPPPGLRSPHKPGLDGAEVQRVSSHMATFSRVAM